MDRDRKIVLAVYIALIVFGYIFAIVFTVVRP